MDIKLLQEVNDWYKSTDLVEFLYKDKKNSIEFKNGQSPFTPASFSCTLEPVCAGAVGIYRLDKQGKSKKLSEGMPIKTGQNMGYIQTNKGETPVVAPSSGALRVISIQDGEPVEYGQPLFFIEP